MAFATWTSERLLSSACTIGIAGMRIGSGSSSSSDARHRRQRLLVVLNWTRWQSSHLTTSRESTGARVVAIQVRGVPEQAQQLMRTLRHSASGVKYVVGGKGGENSVNSGVLRLNPRKPANFRRNTERLMQCRLFTNYIHDRFLIVRLRRCRYAISDRSNSRDLSLRLIGVANEVGINCRQQGIAVQARL